MVNVSLPHLLKQQRYKFVSFVSLLGDYTGACILPLVILLLVIAPVFYDISGLKLLPVHSLSSQSNDLSMLFSHMQGGITASISRRCSFLVWYQYSYRRHHHCCCRMHYCRLPKPPSYQKWKKTLPNGLMHVEHFQWRKAVDGSYGNAERIMAMLKTALLGHRNC